MGQREMREKALSREIQIISAETHLKLKRKKAGFYARVWFML